MKSIYTEISKIEKDGTVAALAILIDSTGSTPRKATTKMIVFENGSIFGTIGGGKLEHLVIEEAKKVIKSNTPGVFEYDLTMDAGMSCGGFAKVYIEPIETQKKLYIFGAGHIGSYLAKISIDLGFNVTLIDEREGIFNDLNNNKISFINETHSKAINEVVFNKNTFICVMTHNHEYDREIIGMCGKHKFAYLGMIGSKSKIALNRKIFLEKEILTNEEMDKIDWPMGVKINCQTPEEISISILAKLIDVKAAK